MDVQILVGGGWEEIKTAREHKGKSIIAFPSEYCVVDLETTGLSPEWDDIIEVAAVKYSDGKEVDRFQSLVQPQLNYDGTYVDEFITELTGITNEMLASAPAPEDILPLFFDFIGTSIIIGHNITFDVNFLYDKFERYLNKPFPNDHINTIRFAHKLYPNLPHYRLSDMIDFLKVNGANEHRALSDVLATHECYLKMCEEARKQYPTEQDFAKAFNKHYLFGFKAADIKGDSSKVDTDNPLYGQHCVFTGKLDRLTRREAMQIVADLGGINEDTVTKKTNFLILGNNDYCSSIKDGKSSKHKKAEKNKLKGQNIEIIPESVFYDMISEE